MSTLAIKGGDQVRTELFPAHNFIGDEEKRAAMEVLDSGNLSQFLGSWHERYFFGGSKVVEFESLWAESVSAKHAVSVNSNTSGLVAAVGAAGVGPGDEVIVPPWSMSATATAIIAYGGVPVFADIKDDIFCIDPEDIRRKITPRTKAIMVVDLFGHPCDVDEIMAIAAEHDLVVIEDAAQAPGAVYKGKRIGALSHMTVFSLNCHKHIHTGEGGVVTTNDSRLAERLQLIRNHGENVVEAKGVTELANTFGFNLRYTELHAAVAIEQLKKLPDLLDRRIANADHLAAALGEFPGIEPPVVREGCRHVYYVQPFTFDANTVGVARDTFIAAVSAELPRSGDDLGRALMWPGYVMPLYLLPMYQTKTAYARGYPFASGVYEGTVEYGPGLCPVVERCQKEVFLNDFIRPPADTSDMDDVVRAFEKVYEHKDELHAIETD